MFMSHVTKYYISAVITTVTLVKVRRLEYNMDMQRD